MTEDHPNGSAELSERSIAGMRWIRVGGPRDACFRALGAHAEHSICYVVDKLFERQAHVRAASTQGGRKRVEAVVNATEERYPEHVAELSALAAGAGVPLDPLLLLSLDGDLGDGTQPADAGIAGCSDVALRGDHLVLAHNEDEDAGLFGRVDLLTLQLDGEPAICALWYPGMLPSDAFTLTGSLAWGIDHLPVREPRLAPGRSFVARALQSVENLDDPVEFLRSHPSAGGFAYTMADAQGGRVLRSRLPRARFPSQRPATVPPARCGTRTTRATWPAKRDVQATRVERGERCLNASWTLMPRRHSTWIDWPRFSPRRCPVAPDKKGRIRRCARWSSTSPQEKSGSSVVASRRERERHE